MLYCLLLHIVLASNRVALVSYHGGNDDGQVNNLYRYDFADNPNEFVLLGPLIANEKALKLRSPRGMLYNEEGDYLLHLNAYKGDSKIVKTQDVSGGSGVGAVFSSANLLHPYGIAMHPEDPHVYVSNQGTGDISRYTLDGLPTVDPVFAHVNDPRAIAFDGSSNLWVADKNTTSLIRLDVNGNITKSIVVVNPIGMTIYQDLVFISSDNGPDESAVFAYSADTGALSRTFRGPSGAIHHPCGLVIDAPSDSLYVMSQSARQIVRFELSSGNYVGAVLTGLGDVPEHIIIVPYTPPAPSDAPSPMPSSLSPSSSPTIYLPPTLPAPSMISPTTLSLSPSHTLYPSPFLPPTAQFVQENELSDLQIVLVASGSGLVVLLLALFLFCRIKRRKPHALLAYEEQYRVN